MCNDYKDERWLHIHFRTTSVMSCTLAPGKQIVFTLESDTWWMMDDLTPRIARRWHPRGGWLAGLPYSDDVGARCSAKVAVCWDGNWCRTTGLVSKYLSSGGWLSGLCSNTYYKAIDETGNMWPSPVSSYQASFVDCTMLQAAAVDEEERLLLSPKRKRDTHSGLISMWRASRSRGCIVNKKPVIPSVADYTTDDVSQITCATGWQSITGLCWEPSTDIAGYNITSNFFKQVQQGVLWG